MNDSPASSIAGWLASEIPASATKVAAVSWWRALPASAGNIEHGHYLVRIRVNACIAES
jgi:hypothetical protein